MKKKEEKNNREENTDYLLTYSYHVIAGYLNIIITMIESGWRETN